MKIMFIPPMLLQYSKNNEPFDHPSYLAELKLDGIRMIVSNMDELKLYTRHNNDVTAKYKELHDTPLPKGTVLDGELIVTDAKGQPDFEACMSRFQSSKSKHKVTFCAFDILYHRGIDVTSLPLTRRKELLEQAFEETDYYKKVRPIDGSSVDFFELVKANGLEGIVMKKKDSKYVKNTRSWSWQKVIAYDQAEVYITGYNKKEFGWLIGVMENGKIRNVGTMELGVSTEERKAIWPVLQRTKIKDSKNYVYVEPLVRCKVKYRDWYKSGMMRLPVFEEFIV